MRIPNTTAISTRIQRLKASALQGGSERLAQQRHQVYERSLAKTVGEPQVMRVATALAAYLRERDILMDEDDALAGYGQFLDYTLPARWNTALCDARDGPFVEDFRRGFRVGLFRGGMGGHVIAGYHRVLARGLGGLAQDAADRLAAWPPDDPRRDFASASLTALRGASDCVRRYARRASELAAEATDAEARARLTAIADSCRRVATQPPQGFRDAVQLTWFVHELLTCEQKTGSLSLGRLDQYLYPFYAQDEAAGRITYQEASELIQALWLKLARMRRGFQNVTLGGADAQGRYLANPVSFMCLQATATLAMDQPLLSVRWHPSMPDDFWAEIVALLQTGIGLPALFNDAVVMDAKRRMGVSAADALDYGIVGCVEPSIPGREHSHTEGLRVSWSKALELVLNDGVCAMTGERMPLRTPRDLNQIRSFDAFLSWYLDELVHDVALSIRGLNAVDAHYPLHINYPFLSSTMVDCLERGLDVTAGGTRYNLSTVNGLGMANTADGLAAIKRVVFEQELVTLSELAQALRDDFAGAEGLRQALRAGPNYGNDRDEADLLLKAVADAFCGEINRHTNPRGGKVQAGLYTVEAHTMGGKMTGASPDGRHRGLSLASGCSPAQGAEVCGPTAAIRSITKLDHGQLGNGIVFDLKFEPTFFAEMRQRGIFRPLVETYMNLGGQEMQFNVVGRETLLAARRAPEQHKHLLVRVSGFSAYFVDLDPLTQEEIIARTTYAEM